MRKRRRKRKNRRKKRRKNKKRKKKKNKQLLIKKESLDHQPALHPQQGPASQVESLREAACRSHPGSSLV